jgi:serine/threonine-protein kinase RIO1
VIVAPNKKVDNRTEQEKKTEERNKQQAKRMFQIVATQVNAYNNITSMYGKAQQNLTNINNMFVDGDGVALATSTVALNIGVQAVKVAIQVWQEWNEYNKKMIEYSETLRRLGVGNMDNRRDMSTSWFSSQVTGESATVRRRW